MPKDTTDPNDSTYTPTDPRDEPSDASAQAYLQDQIDADFSHLDTATRRAMVDALKDLPTASLRPFAPLYMTLYRIKLQAHPSAQLRFVRLAARCAAARVAFPDAALQAARSLEGEDRTDFLEHLLALPPHEVGPRSNALARLMGFWVAAPDAAKLWQCVKERPAQAASCARVFWYRGTTPADHRSLDRFFASPLGERWPEYDAAAALALPAVGPGARALTLSLLARDPAARQAVPHAIELLHSFGKRSAPSFPYLLRAFTEISPAQWQAASGESVRLKQAGEARGSKKYSVHALPTLRFFGELPNEAAMRAQGEFLDELMARATKPADERDFEAHTFVVEALQNAVAVADASARAQVAQWARWSLQIDRNRGTAAHENAAAPYTYLTLLERVLGVARLVSGHHAAQAAAFIEQSPNLLPSQDRDGRRRLTELLAAMSTLHSQEEFALLHQAYAEVASTQPTINISVLCALIETCSEPQAAACGATRLAIARDAKQLWSALAEGGAAVEAPLRSTTLRRMAATPQPQRASKLEKALQQARAGSSLQVILYGADGAY